MARSAGIEKAVVERKRTTLLDGDYDGPSFAEILTELRAYWDRGHAAEAAWREAKRVGMTHKKADAVLRRALGLDSKERARRFHLRGAAFLALYQTVFEYLRDRDELTDREAAHAATEWVADSEDRTFDEAVVALNDARTAVKKTNPKFVEELRITIPGKRHGIV